MVGRSSEDPLGQTLSSLQKKTDIPLWEQRWTMRFQILTAKILLIYYAYDFTMEHSGPAGQQGGT